MLRINITIPSDLYEECQQTCEKQKISFSQLVRTALIEKIKTNPQFLLNPVLIENEDISLKKAVIEINERLTQLELAYYSQNESLK